MIGEMKVRASVAVAFGVMAFALSLGAQGQTTQPPKVVPPIIAPTMPTVPGVRTPAPASTGISTRSPLTAIVGQVVDTSGRPVARAAVRLIADRVIETVLTDPKGRFVFTQIPSGEMVVTAEKYGYFDGGFGQRRATGLPLPFSLQYGQAMPNMKVEIFRGSVVTGSVRDEAGEAIVGAEVIASRRQFVRGEWQYVGVGSELTDDNGNYRIFGLQPGDYIVAVGSTPVAPNQQGETQPQDLGKPSLFPRTYYPQANERILALPVSLMPGDVRYSVNFTLPPVTTRRITGRLIGPDAAIADQTIKLVPMDASWATDDGGLVMSLHDGTFAFEHVADGRYRIQAGNVTPRTWTAGNGTAMADAIDAARPYCGTAEVSVQGADVTVADIQMVQTAAVAGRLELVRAAQGQGPAEPRRIQISVEPAEAGLSRAVQTSVAPGVPFAVSNLVPGPYFVRVGAIPSGWALRSINVDGNEAIDHAIDLKDADAIVTIELGDRGTLLIGTVRDPRMQAAQGAAVIILPAGVPRENWSPNRVRETRTSTSGVFTVRGLPPGDYLVIVIDDGSAEGWQDERVIARLMPLATRFTLHDLETLSLVLQMR